MLVHYSTLSQYSPHNTYTKSVFTTIIHKAHTQSHKPLWPHVPHKELPLTLSTHTQTSTQAQAASPLPTDNVHATPIHGLRRSPHAANTHTQFTELASSGHHTQQLPLRTTPTEADYGSAATKHQIHALNPPLHHHSV